MAYTYDDFMRAAQGSGLMGQFSQYDLDLAKKYPEFGLSMLSLKKDWNSAATEEQKLLANEAANELRKSYGQYTGGADGSDYISQGKLAGQIDDTLEQMGSFQDYQGQYSGQIQDVLEQMGSFQDYQGQYSGQIQDVLDQMAGYGPFSYDAQEPTYENQYAQQQKDLLDQLLNREEFSWNKETDPLWGVYKKQYLREGDRATAEALGQASAASGGRPSSYAVGAATQAGDYYATKLNDIIPTLYQQAYEKYLQEYSMKQQDLGAVNAQEQLDYGKYLDRLGQYNQDRNFAYQDYLNRFEQLQSRLSALQGQDSTDYARYLDQFGLLQDQLSALQGQDSSDYARYLDQYGLLQDRLSALQGQDSANYARYLDQLNRQTQREETDYQRQQDQMAIQRQEQEDRRQLAAEQAAAILQAGGQPSQELLAAAGLTDEYAQGLYGAFQRDEADKRQALMQAQVDAIIKAGGTPSQELVAASGYSNEYVQALVAAMQRQLAATTTGKTSGSSGGSRSSGGSSGTTAATSAIDATVQAFNKGDHSDATIEKLLAAGFTREQIEQAGYTGTYFSTHGTAGGNPNGYVSTSDLREKSTAGTASKGTSYNAIWYRARTMHDQGRSEQEIMAYLDKFSETQLTQEGLEYIMSSLNLGGYRTGGK